MLTAHPNEPSSTVVLPAEGEALHGVEVVPLDAHHDRRGSFTEVFSSERDHLAARQWSVVRSGAGVLRGMHLHRRHDEFVHCVSGTMTVGLFDARPGSPTFRRWALHRLSGAEPTALTFPAGIVHGWLFHEPSVHLQAVTEPYSSYAHDDNEGCRWDDPDLGIPWPFAPTTISERAAGFPTLGELLSMVEVDPVSDRRAGRPSHSAL